MINQQPKRPTPFLDSLKFAIDRETGNQHAIATLQIVINPDTIIRLRDESEVRTAFLEGIAHLLSSALIEVERELEDIKPLIIV